jgi:hypothetical protein
VLRRVSKRRAVSSVVAVTPDGRLSARHFRTSIASRCVILALRDFRRKIGMPLLVVWDRLNAHRSRATAAFIAAHAPDFAVADLPAYAPELNPEEQCNACVKRPWRTRCRNQWPTCTVSRAASSAACSADPR